MAQASAFEFETALTMIETRRDYGSGRSHGIPWVVEINGLGGMLTLKKGRVDQEVGTTVVITSRPKPAFFDSVEDQVKLTSVLNQYALAVEFPIYTRCTVQEIAEKLDLPPGIRPVPTELESVGVRRVRRFEQELFGYLDSQLQTQQLPARRAA